MQILVRHNVSPSALLVCSEAAIKYELIIPHGPTRVGFRYRKSVANSSYHSLEGSPWTRDHCKPKAATHINTRPGISSGQSSDSKMGVSCGNVYAYYDGHYNAQPWTLTSSGPGAEHFCTVSSVSQQLQMSA